MKKTHLLAFTCLCALVLASPPARPLPLSAASELSPQPESVEGRVGGKVALRATLYVLRVYVHNPRDVSRLTRGPWDVLEARGKDYLLVQGDDATLTALQRAGFTVQIDHVLDTSSALAPFSYDGGYHTVAEHYQHMDDVVRQHPTLALTVTYGISWLRSVSPTAGYDLRAICITHLKPGDCTLNPETVKPRFFLMAALHARELTTAELAWRWIDYLVNNDGIDPNVTALLEYHEMWVVPVANPDGRAIVEQGGNAPYLQRKNADDLVNNLPVTCLSPTDPYYEFYQPGVDLNRNASFMWGVAGASTSPCDQAYLGAAQASEPEEQALEWLMGSLFPHQRGSSITDTSYAAPITTTGIMLTLHSYANLLLLPWSWTDCSDQPCPPDLRAPNDVPLRALAFHMSYYNGYSAGQSSEVLYAASGTSDDWAYAALGIPGFTFEVGPNLSGDPCTGFTPPYSCQDSLFWPQNVGAFLYAAQVAGQPYTLGLGPVTQMPTSTLLAPINSTTRFTATLYGDLYGNAGVDRPAAQTIQAARFTLDTPPWVSGSISTSMMLGGPLTTTQVVTGTLPGDLAPGRHWLFVQGQDTNGNWGPVAARWVLVPRYTLRLILVYRN